MVSLGGVRKLERIKTANNRNANSAFQLFFVEAWCGQSSRSEDVCFMLFIVSFSF